jgi:hypothetical protein
MVSRGVFHGGKSLMRRGAVGVGPSKDPLLIELRGGKTLEIYWASRTCSGEDFEYLFRWTRFHFHGCN